VKNKKKGLLELLSSLLSAWVNFFEKAWELIVRWKKILWALSALVGLVLTIYHLLAKQEEAAQPFTDGSALVINPAHSTPLKLTLSDGTRVTLAYSSFIRYKKQLDGNTREVTIGGQAEFEVAPDMRPFIVHADGIDIRVLGTHFNVMNYAGEPTTVTLLDGKVQVMNSKCKEELEPAQQATVNSGQIKVKKLHHPKSCLDWATDPPYFSFENDSLGKVLREFGRWYGVTIDNPEKLTGDPVGGIWLRSFTLEQILPCIERVQYKSQLKLEKVGDTIKVIKHP